jgi:hypothetical protein
MRVVGRVFPLFVIFLLVCAVLNLLFQDTIVTFLNQHIPSLAGFFSGPWWQSVPAWLLAIAASITLFITIYQSEQSRKSTNAQIAMGIFKELRSLETVRRLQAIYKREDNDPNKLHDTENDDITYIVDRFEILGILVDKGIVDEDIAINAYGGASALRCWYKLHNYIKK